MWWRASRLLLLAGLALPLLLSFGWGQVKGETLVSQGSPFLESVVLYGASNSYVLDMGDASAALIEAKQSGSGGSLALLITDSASPSGFSTITDPNGTRAAIKANKKFLVYNVRRFLSCSVNDPTVGTTTGNWTVIATPVRGATWQPPFADSMLAQRASNLASGSIATIWTPSTGNRIRLLKMVISATAAGRYYLDDNNNVKIWLPLQASVPFTLDLTPWGYTTAADNNALGIENGSGSTATVDVWMWGHEE